VRSAHKPEAGVGQRRGGERVQNCVQAPKEKSECVMAVVKREGRKRRKKKELQHREGRCYLVGRKKFWTLTSSPHFVFLCDAVRM